MAQKKTNILSRFKRKSLELLTAGAMASGVLSGCSGDGPTPPIPPPPTNQSPTADFTASSYTPLRADYNGSASRDPDGSIVNYVWTFGDGSADSTSGAIVSHNYSNSGGYNPCLVVEDNKGARSAQSCKQVNVDPIPQRRISGYLEDVLTGAKVSGVPVLYQNTAKDTSDANGAFDFQVPASSDTLKINSTQLYNVKIPINATGQNVNLANLQMIKRYVDPVTGEDLLTFMKNYMQPSRWDDADLPIKVFIDNNPPSPEYREAVRQGVMSWDDAVNAWLPEGRRLILAQIVNADPATGIKVEYDSPTTASFTFTESFKKGLIKMNPAQVVAGAIRSSAHEEGHALFGPKPLPFTHSPYVNHLMYGLSTGTNGSSSLFEGLVVATKYKLKKGATEFYSK
ncbi:MAG: PKD domain-containing protein, partial [Nanoarchaeota archaeon]